MLLHESAKVRFPHVAVEDGEDHEMGNVRMAILHTPGHTPESISILVTDRSRAVEPWFVLTGDTLFSGGVGRPVKAARAGPCDRPALSIYTGRRNVLRRAAPPRVGAGERPRQPAVLQVQRPNVNEMNMSLRLNWTD